MSRPFTSSLLFLLGVAAVASSAGAAGEPDYAEWNRLLAGYYDPAKGMDYGGLKSREGKALERLRQAMGKVDVSALDRDERLAYWINVYNINVVGVVVDNYPVESIRDLSTDPIVRLNVFKKPAVPFGSGVLSLDDVEHEKVRRGFRDPRIHFALNCAAVSCPTLRREAYVGAPVDAQLDDQVRRFMAGPGLRVERKGGRTLVHTSKVMDWFGDDFEGWAGGVLPFIRKHAPPEKARLIPAKGNVKVEFDDYSWTLNDWKR